MLIDKLRYLEDIILVGTDLCRKSVTHICTYLTETIKRVNFATERVRDSDINALANQCPNITYLNISETLVSYYVFFKMVTTWKPSMVYLCLPHGIANDLGLTSDQIVNHPNLESLTQLWLRNIVNPNDTPTLNTLAQFQTMVDSMNELRYLNIGNKSGMMPQNLFGVQHHTRVLKRLFRHLTINMSPYEEQCPVEEDPISVFKNRHKYTGQSTDSNPSASPNSTASTIPIDDSDQ